VTHSFPKFGSRMSRPKYTTDSAQILLLPSWGPSTIDNPHRNRIPLLPFSHEPCHDVTAYPSPHHFWRCSFDSLLPGGHYFILASPYVAANTEALPVHRLSPRIRPPSIIPRTCSTSCEDDYEICTSASSSI
jgi:hypothetical protein